MRLVSYDDGSGPRAGMLADGEIVPLSHPARTVRGLLGAGDVVEVEVDGLGVLGNPVQAA